MSNKNIFIKKSNKVHENKYDYSNIIYKNAKTKVSIICPAHGIFKQTPTKHLSGRGCITCYKEKYYGTLEKFIKKSNKVHENKYDYSSTIYVNNTTKVSIICPTHGMFKQNPKEHTSGQGCKECNKERRKLSNPIEKFIEIHGNKYSYSFVNYINMITKVSITCPAHGNFNQLPKNHIEGKGCPKCKCNISKGEKMIINYLNKNNIKYITQKTFNECKHINKLRFDFYLPKLNIIIEFDGKQHFAPIKFFGGINEHKNIQIRDNIKNKYCKENKIYLIRIPYYENVEDILKKELN